jgi:hypothetical protein
MAAVLLLVLHEKKEVDSTSKYCAELEKYNAPALPDVKDLNKQFETYTAVLDGVCLPVYNCEL